MLGGVWREHIQQWGGRHPGKEELRECGLWRPFSAGADGIPLRFCVSIALQYDN